MGAPKSRAREVTRAVMLPTGAHGLVARPYEPLADSRAGTHGPTKPVSCSRFRRHRQIPEGTCLWPLSRVVERHRVSAPTTAVMPLYCDLYLYLLDLDLGAGFLELLLEGLGVGLADAFLDGLRRAVHQVLGLLQAQARDFAHGLDRVHLVLAGGDEDDRELGLLLDRGGTAGSRRGDGDRRGGGGNAELLFHVLDELRELEDAHVPDRVENFLLGDSHCVCSCLRIVKWVAGKRRP